jgi:hypothetical protein
VNGLKEPGSPGAGPAPVHWSCPPVLPPLDVVASWQKAKTGAGHPLLAGWPGCPGASLDGSHVGDALLKLSQPETT